MRHNLLERFKKNDCEVKIIKAFNNYTSGWDYATFGENIKVNIYIRRKSAHREEPIYTVFFYSPHYRLRWTPDMESVLFESSLVLLSKLENKRKRAYENIDFLPCDINYCYDNVTAHELYEIYKELDICDRGADRS